jgi:hypothetical protein
MVARDQSLPPVKGTVLDHNLSFVMKKRIHTKEDTGTKKQTALE